MNNGATVSDWLGTAHTNAAVAATRLEGIRAGRETNDLEYVEELLQSAIDDVYAVRLHLAHLNAYGGEQ
jgi:hypothetical protein